MRPRREATDRVESRQLRKLRLGRSEMERPRVGPPHPAMSAIEFLPEKKKARIEIIPLIDVVFFLLATFVLFTLSLDRLSTIEAPLPKVPPPGKYPDDSTMVHLQAGANGTVYWKQGRHGTPELISMTEVGYRLAEYKRTAPVPKVFIRGDGKARFGSAVLLFDEVRKVGIQQVSIETVLSSNGT